MQEQTMGADARDGGGRGDSRSGIQGGAGIGPLMILLIALAIMIGIGIWISRGSLFNVAGMTQNTARMEASTLQQTGSSISSAFGAAMFRDSFLPDQITFDTAARTSSSVGIFNPADGFMAKPPIQLSALTAGTLSGSDIVWQRMQATIPEVGTGATYVTVLPGIRTQVCQAINSAKWGTPPSDPVPVASNVSSNNVTAGLGNTTAVGNVTLDLSATSPAAWSDRRDEGCMASSDGVNFYFKVISVS